MTGKQWFKIDGQMYVIYYACSVIVTWFNMFLFGNYYVFLYSVIRQLRLGHLETLKLQHANLFTNNDKLATSRTLRVVDIGENFKKLNNWM